MPSGDALLLIAALLAIDLLRKHQDLAAGLLLGLVAVKPQLIFLAVIAVAVLIGIRRRVDTPHFAIIAIALAVIVGLHTLAYDVLFLAPLGMLVAQSRPWSVVAAGWVFTVAQLRYPDGPGRCSPSSPSSSPS
jgi:hypothetical protein